MKPEEREYIPIYNRKLARSVIRAGYNRMNGQHNVSKAVSYIFHQMRDGEGVAVRGANNKEASDNKD